MEINHNFGKLKIGESACYHIGCLAIDRAEKEILGCETKLNKRGVEQEYVIYGNYTDAAIICDRVATEVLRRSTCKVLPESDLEGTGEFELYQKKIVNNYHYYARRIAPK